MDVPTITVIGRVARLSDDRLESFWLANVASPKEPLIMCYSIRRPLVIQGLLAGYDAKPLGAGLGRDNYYCANSVK
ncbi:hypothetical protein CsSME_00053393 [Camellia sinensis var. sinensis]